MTRTQRHRKAAPCKARLRLEILEDRCVPAGYLQTNLVSDVPGLAINLDPNLKNPWGLVASPSSPWWVSDNNAGVSTLYNGAGQPFPIASPLVVTIPTASGPGTLGSPSGVVFNGSKTDFIVSQGKKSGPAAFIFATEDGLIAAWSPAVDRTNAIVEATVPGAMYEGLTSLTTGLGTFLLAANQNGGIDVFDSKFNLIHTANDTKVPAGFAPYGIQNINGKIYVTYADPNASPSAVGNGLVDVFDPLTGNFHRLITGGHLNLPWGMVIAPSDFGQFSGDLLVGNVADGHIDAYNPRTGRFLGQLRTSDGKLFTEPGLWSLKFGNGSVAGDPDTLFFTAGINNYADGLLGSLQVPRHPAPVEPTNETIIPHLPPSPTLVVSTNSPSGDQNPYGIAYVPQFFPPGGLLHPGDLLVSNFNNATNPDGTGNLQGTGRTIMRITPNGQTSVFFQGPPGIGLTTALGVLSSGFVLVGNVPTTDGTSDTIKNGSLIIIDRFGHEVANLTDSKLLRGPWDLTLNDLGNFAQVFVSNVLSGTVTRIDLVIPFNGTPTVLRKTQIASGYLHRPDQSALVIGPTGLAFDPSRDLLYVASTGDNAIFAIRNASERTSDAGKGRLVYKDDKHLHGPLGLLLAPNGNLITANGDAVNADPKQPSEIVEFTPKGQFVGQISLNPEFDAPFGIAFQFTEPGDEIEFAAVDDNTNTVHVWTLPVTTDEDFDDFRAAAHAAHVMSVHGSLAASKPGDLAFIGPLPVAGPAGGHMGALPPLRTAGMAPSNSALAVGMIPSLGSAMQLAGAGTGAEQAVLDRLFAELGTL
jgi:uncharacterized protein (TIGR03118 family)